MTKEELLKHEAMRPIAEQLHRSPIDYQTHMPWLEKWFEIERSNHHANK